MPYQLLELLDVVGIQRPETLFDCAKHTGGCLTACSSVFQLETVTAVCVVQLAAFTVSGVMPIDVDHLVSSHPKRIA